MEKVFEGSDPEIRPEKERYESGDVLTVSYNTSRLRPRRLAVLEANGPELTLSWGLKNRGFRYFRARLEDGRLQFNGREILVLSSEKQAGETEARLFQVYRQCIEVGKGAPQFSWDAPLEPEERRAVMQAIYRSTDLSRDYQRILALKCLYGEGIGAFPTDFEESGLEKPQLEDGRKYQLVLDDI